MYMYVLKTLTLLFIGTSCTALLVMYAMSWRSFVKSKTELLAYCIVCYIHIHLSIWAWNGFFTLIAPFIR